MKKKKLSLTLLGIFLPLAASHVARMGLGKGFETVVRRPPPKNPASPAVPWKEAIAWSIAAGITGGLTRLVTRRLLTPTPIPVEGEPGSESDDSYVTD